MLNAFHEADNSNIWNRLLYSIVDASTVNAFKAGLDKVLIAPNS